MKCRTALFALAMVATTAGLSLAADRTETVTFKAGSLGATRSGEIKGHDGAVYVLGARSGQVMQVLFSPGNGSCYFNVGAPGGGEAVFNGSISGNEFSANLDRSGGYRVQVYLMRNAARRGETCSYKISFEIGG